ncbi:MAG: hypothetical protein J0I34_05570 [Pseudonocardia sp.]|uniref:hypothetical protein n=1 Tax=unclassified Pseudonocardia TaxID=2619320 RepID=UPI000868FCE7|nr:MULTISPECIES: hypothetical protein [unclassified Pseudonocardia]MBN9108233.1 hypothetical protein [Pseudonocardia sp.]ODV08636.1 MAG: hypothetical protein ABT15_02045 [Pseudonocardia sp. SCN 73-27]
MTDERDQHVADEHVMVLEGDGPSGAEEWHCPTCGRTVVVRWEPDFEQLVLVEGDTRAAHAGSRHGGVRLGPPTRRPATARPATGAADVGDDDAWARWLADHGLGDD